MKENNEESRQNYFDELSICLAREGFSPGKQEDGMLPVLWQGLPLCKISEAGAVYYKSDDANSGSLELPREKAADIARTVRQYMRLMESAPQLNARGLDEGYKLLADFNGVVLAGHRSQYGVQFVTWDRDYDGRGVSHGHYAAHHYEEAKKDFAARSGLISEQQLFNPEQLIEISGCRKNRAAQISDRAAGDR